MGITSSKVQSFISILRSLRTISYERSRHVFNFCQSSNPKNYHHLICNRDNKSQELHQVSKHFAHVTCHLKYPYTMSRKFPFSFQTYLLSLQTKLIFPSFFCFKVWWQRNLSGFFTFLVFVCFLSLLDDEFWEIQTVFSRHLRSYVFIPGSLAAEEEGMITHNSLGT